MSNISETFANCGSKSLKWPKSPPSKVLQLEEDLSTWCKVLDIFRELLNVSSQMESALAFPCVSLHSALQKGDIFSPHCLPISNTDYVFTTDKRNSKCISLATCTTRSDFAYWLVSKNLIHLLNKLVLLQAGDAEWTTVRVGASRQSSQVDSEVANPFSSIYAL